MAATNTEVCNNLFFHSYLHSNYSTILQIATNFTSRTDKLMHCSMPQTTTAYVSQFLNRIQHRTWQTKLKRFNAYIKLLPTGIHDSLEWELLAKLSQDGLMKCQLKRPYLFNLLCPRPASHALASRAHLTPTCEKISSHDWNLVRGNPHAENPIATYVKQHQIWETPNISGTRGCHEEIQYESYVHSSTICHQSHHVNWQSYVVRPSIL